MSRDREAALVHGVMRMLRMACFLIVPWGWCAISRAQSSAETKPEAENLLRITEEAHGLTTELGRPQIRVIVEIRGDTPERKKFINDLWTRYSDAFPADYRIHYLPDSSFTQIELRRKGEKLVVGSWHTAEADNPKIVATAHGLTSLEGRKRADVLAEQPAKYRRFREAFDAILAAAERFELRR